MRTIDIYSLSGEEQHDLFTMAFLTEKELWSTATAILAATQFNSLRYDRKHVFCVKIMARVGPPSIYYADDIPYAILNICKDYKRLYANAEAQVRTRPWLQWFLGYKWKEQVILRHVRRARKESESAIKS